ATARRAEPVAVGCTSCNRGGGPRQAREKAMGFRLLALAEAKARSPKPKAEKRRLLNRCNRSGCSQRQRENVVSRVLEDGAALVSSEMAGPRASEGHRIRNAEVRRQRVGHHVARISL